MQLRKHLLLEDQVSREAVQTMHDDSICPVGPGESKCACQAWPVAHVSTSGSASVPAYLDQSVASSSEPCTAGLLLDREPLSGVGLLVSADPQVHDVAHAHQPVTFGPRRPCTGRSSPEVSSPQWAPTSRKSLTIRTLRNVGDEDLARAVSAEVRRLVEERGLSGNKLAKAAGLEQTGVAAKLRGAVAFSLRDLAAIAPVLEVKVTDIIEWAQRS